MEEKKEKPLDVAILKEILDTGRIGFWDWNIPSGNEYFSSTMKKMFGYEDHEIPNRRESILLFVIEDDFKIAMEKFQDHVRSFGQIPFSCEIRNRHKNGSLVWVLTRGSVVEWDADGKPVRMVGCNIDITEQKQSEDNQRNLAANLQAVLGSTNDIIASYDTELRLIVFNKAFSDIYNTLFNVNIYPGMRTPDLFPEAMQKIWEPANKRALAGESFTIEFDLPYSNGDVRSYEERYCPIIKNEVITGFTTFTRDITERKRTERALSESEVNYRTLVNNMQDAVYRCDLEGNIIFASPSSAIMLGYPSTKIMNGLNITDNFYLYPEERQKLIEIMKINGRVSEYEVTLKRSDGTPVIVRTNSHFYRDSSGKIVGIEGVYHDVTGQVKAEEAINEREALLRSIFEASPAGIALAVERAFTMVNSALCRITGYREEELVGQKTRIVFFSDEEYIKAGTVYSELAEKGIAMTEARLRHKNGNEIYSLLCLSPLNKGNIYNGVITTILDITNLKKAEQIINKNETLLRSLFDASPAGIVMLVNRVFTNINTAMCQITGYSQEELYGVSTRILYFNDEEYNRASNVYLELKDKCPDIVETFFKRKDGSEINVLICVNPIDSENMELGVVATVLDITQIRKAEQALKKNETLMQSIFNASPAGITLLDNRVLTMTNNALCTITGYSKDEILGKNAHMFYFDDEEYYRVGRLYMQIEHCEMVITESRFKKKDGSEINVLICFNPLDPNDYSAGVVATLLDITELKKMEYEKQKLEEMLLHSQKLESMGRLAGGVAHDFNNMLTAILGNAELVKEYISRSSNAYSKVEIIENAAISAANLTKQLLAFSRKQVIEPKILNLNDAVKNIQKMIFTLLGENIKLDIITDNNLREIKADPGQIEQIILNLSVNARDAMPEGGKLIIETRNATLDNAYSKTHLNVTPGIFVMLAISDTGAGMSKEVIDHCFEPFYTTKDKGKGTGLGLSTVYGIVNQAGGTIEVYSEVGNGTVFKLYFPVVNSKDITDMGVIENETQKTGNETILIAEDNEYVLEFSMNVLQGAGYNVMSAVTGENALNIALNYSEKIDLLITDVILPGINGKETSEKMMTIHPESKILYNSGYTAEVIDRQGILDEGINFINKPFTSRQLLSKVREILDQNR